MSKFSSRIGLFLATIVWGTGTGCEVLASQNNLENFCILPKDICKIDEAKDPSDCAVRPLGVVVGNSFQKELWAKNGSRCVAIIRVALDGKALLNPEGYNYGPIPSLQKLTELDADALWGTINKSRKGNIVNYKLKTYQSPKIITIQAIFENSHLRKYKILGAASSTQEWNIVD